MSLTELLRVPDVQRALEPLIKRAAFPIARESEPHIDGNPSLVGMAFDYALRWGLYGTGWAHAEETMAELADRLANMSPRLRDSPEVADVIWGALDVARTIRPDTLSNMQAAACLKLAEYDLHYRSGVEWPQGPTQDQCNLRSVQSMYTIVPWARFKPKMRLVLNPTFGIGSRSVGGADADIVLDDTIVEIKTMRDPTASIQAIHQLVGYAILARAFGISSSFPDPTIVRVGFYVARSGELVTLPFASFITPKNESEVLHIILRAAAVRPSFPNPK